MTILDKINKEKETRPEDSKLNFKSLDLPSSELSKPNLSKAKSEPSKLPENPPKPKALKKSDYKKNYTFSFNEGTIDRLKEYCFKNKLKYNETIEVFIDEALERRKV